MGIKGVPKPESIVTKASSSTSSAASEASEKASEKIARKVEEAVEVVGTMLADTDDSQDHNEL